MSVEDAISASAGTGATNNLPAVSVSAHEAETERNIPESAWDTTTTMQRHALVIKLVILAILASTLTVLLVVAQEPPKVSEAEVKAVMDQMAKAESDDDLWQLEGKLVAMGRAAVPHIKKLVARSLHGMTQVACYRALADLGDRDTAVEKLTAIAHGRHETDIESQRAAAELLSQVCNQLDETKLLTLLEQVADPDIKISVCKALWNACRETIKSLPTLRELMKSDSTPVKLAAALAYAETGRVKDVEELLMQLSEEPSHRGRLAAQLLEQNRLLRALEKVMLRTPPASVGNKIVDPDVNTQIAEELLEMIKQRAAVDVKKLTDAGLMGAAAENMLRTLDPYCAFLPTAADVERSKTIDPLGVTMPSVGLIVGKPGGVVRVVAALDGSPAHAAGIRPYDSITEINGHEVFSWSLPEIEAVLHGEEGKTVDVRIVREGWFVARTYRLPYRKLSIPAPTQSVLPGQVGYLRLPTLAVGQAALAREALQQLLGQNVKTVVLDLRGNPGGSVETAVEIASLFVGANKLVAYSLGRNPEIASRVDYQTKGDALTHLPLVVLVNRGTADAAELLAGALQAHQRAVLVAEVVVGDEKVLNDKRNLTFGKGIVQQIVPLNFKPNRTWGDNNPFKGAALKLTIAFYYLQGDTPIQDVGLTIERSHRDVVMPDWILDEFNKPAFVDGVARYIESLAAQQPDVLQRLADFDDRKPESWPALFELLKNTDSKAPATYARWFVRDAARRHLATTNAQAHRWLADVQDDRALLQAVCVALEQAKIDPKTVAEIDRVR